MTFHIPEDMLSYRFRPSSTAPIEERVPVPELKEGEVLLKILAAGVCHSDVGIFDPTSKINQIIATETFTGGHEGAGIIVRLGASVALAHPSLTLGTYVAVYGANSCWEASCLACTSGNHNVCGKQRSCGIGIDGAWAEYMATRAVNLVPIPGTPAQIPASVVAIATDAVLTPYHALKGCCDVKPGQTVLCYGAGGLGLHAVAIATQLLGAKVIVCDIRESSLRQALDMGAAHAVKSDQLVQYIREHNLVIDIAVDFVGLQSTFDACFAVIRPGGTIHIAGLLAETMNVLPIATMMKNLTLKTSYWGLKDELPEIFQAIADGKLKTLVEERPMSECAHILHELHEGKLKNRVAMIPDSLFRVRNKL